MVTTAYDTAIATGIREAREAAGLSQDELAKRMWIDAGISWRQSTVGKVEKCARTVTAAELWALAQILTERRVDLLLNQVSMRQAQRAAQTAAGTRETVDKRAQTQFNEWSKRAETTANAARALSVDVNEVEGWAMVLWHRSYLAEREARLKKALAKGPGNTSALRRLISREMLSEIQSWVEPDEGVYEDGE